MTPSDRIDKVFRPDEIKRKALSKLKLETIEDLLFYLPSRHTERTETKHINELEIGEKATVKGRVFSQKTKKGFRSKIPMAEMIVEDETGKIKAVWFHQAYMAKKVLPGSFVKVSGTVTKRGEEIYLANPILEENADNNDELFTLDKNSLLPTYPETRGLSSLWIYSNILRALQSDILDKLEDPIPSEILEKYNLPKLKTALVWIHTPKSSQDAEVARKRFAFQEIFLIQLKRLIAREEYRKNRTFQIDVKEAGLESFVKRFPFTMTGAQDKAIKDILNDLKREEPMTRLLEGDVGSGKTAVAATTAYGIVTTRPDNKDFGNLQVAYMAPTEILARQHFESFIEYFKHLPIQIGLITGSECRKFPSKIEPSGHTHVSRTKLLQWVKNGEIPILIGTHALIQKSVEFKHLAYVIIDEQHRFGTMQRAKLTKKDAGRVPHLLSMTATPIPRTLALTIYGDLDLTLLDQMPAGRKPIITEVVSPKNRKQVYEKIRESLKAGRQAYVICPRIDEPDPTKEMAIIAKSVKEEAKRLEKEIFPEFEIDLVHSKMSPKDKEDVMERFASGEVQILVATSVVEVGVNVPNATTIIIEGAERFGLSQLHQLRGRVLRSSHQAYCYLFSDGKTEKTKDRLKALVTAKNGFELSEEDLKLRGPGALSGSKQWGISDIGMEALRNIKMVEAARAEARALIETNALIKFPKLSKLLAETHKDIHFE